MRLTAGAAKAGLPRWSVGTRKGEASHELQIRFEACFDALLVVAIAV